MHCSLISKVTGFPVWLSIVSIGVVCTLYTTIVSISMILNRIEVDISDKLLLHCWLVIQTVEKEFMLYQL